MRYVICLSTLLMIGCQRNEMATPIISKPSLTAIAGDDFQSGSVEFTFNTDSSAVALIKRKKNPIDFQPDFVRIALIRISDMNLIFDNTQYEAVKFGFRSISEFYVMTITGRGSIARIVNIKTGKTRSESDRINE